MPSLHVLIIGGGVGGLVAALWFRHYGYEATVVEQKSRYLESNSAGGLHLGANATSCLKALGIDITEIADVGNDIDIKRYSDGVTVDKKHKEMEHTYMHRSDLLKLLARQAEDAGVVILQGESLETIDENLDSVTANLRSGKQLTADLIIGADGINSKVRSLIPPTKTIEPKLTGQCAFLVDVPKETMEKHPSTSKIYRTGKDPFHMWMGPHRIIIGWTMTRREIYQLQMCDLAYGNGQAYGDPDPDGASFVSRLDDMSSFRKRWSDFEEGIRSICEETQSCWKWRIAEIPELPAWGSENGRLMLLGDAAHAFEPFAGQGAAMAIEDATDLPALLHKTCSLPAVLKAYESIRRPRIETMRQIIKSNIRIYSSVDGREQEKERERVIDDGNGGEFKWESKERFTWIDEYDALKQAQKYQFDAADANGKPAGQVRTL